MSENNGQALPKDVPPQVANNYRKPDYQHGAATSNYTFRVLLVLVFRDASMSVCGVNPLQTPEV